MAIQSKYYKDLSKFEPIYRFGLTRPQLKMILKLVPGTVIIFCLVFFLNMEGTSFWVLSLATGIVFIAPPILQGMGKWEEYRNKLNFFLTDQERLYQYGQIRRYDASEFIQKKEVSEADKS